MKLAGAGCCVAVVLLAGVAVVWLAAQGGQPAANQKTGEGGQQQVDERQKQADENADRNIQQKNKDAK
jgi:hypothetical protein